MWHIQSVPLAKRQKSGWRSREYQCSKQTPPTYEELQAWHARSGLPLRRFFNTSGLVYKSLGLKDKLPAMPEEEQLRLLASDGMLVKRPILVGEDVVLVGFRQEQWAQAVSAQKE